jgi:CheY-like chemotaxis protein
MTGKACRVLAADDDPTMGLMLRAVLASPVFELHYVVDGEAALAAYASAGPFDIVLLDVEMPGIDGLRVAESIRRQQPVLPIVLLTGREDAAFRQALVTLSAYHLAKPVNWASLSGRLLAWRS